MKRIIPVVLALILVSGAFLFDSCKGKEPTTGTLAITVRAQNGSVNGGNTFQIHLATSRENLENGIYLYSNWADANGSTIFHDLQPTYYWYNVDGWADYGAIMIFVGVDASVILWVNTPGTLKK
jgi:hypothetical protein